MNEKTSIRWTRGKSSTVFLAWLGLLISGCSTIDYSRRVEGWPILIAQVHRVTHQEMRTHCAKYSPPLELPLACSEFFLDEGVCRVWIAGHDKGIVEHELAHCAGYDHVGGRTMRAMLEKWQASRSSRVAHLSAGGVIEYSPAPVN
ncbi:MAG: hypothetical protein HY661_19400 [Betaproteobacteria bacterium]|nr:hypothetical protein [Betaproteobacteria bacterium]